MKRDGIYRVLLALSGHAGAAREQATEEVRKANLEEISRRLGLIEDCLRVARAEIKDLEEEGNGT